MQAKAEQAPVQITDKVLEFMAHRIISNVRELEGALNRILAHAMLVGRDTIESALSFWPICCVPVAVRLALTQFRNALQRIMMFGFQRCFQRAGLAILLGRVRWLCLAKNLTSLSYPDIGRQFGGRDTQPLCML